MRNQRQPSREAVQRVLEEYGEKPYEFWRERIDAEPILLEHPTYPAKLIEVNAWWDDPRGKEGVFLIEIGAKWNGPSGEQAIRVWITTQSGKFWQSGECYTAIVGPGSTLAAEVDLANFATDRDSNDLPPE